MMQDIPLCIVELNIIMLLEFDNEENNLLLPLL